MAKEKKEEKTVLKNVEREPVLEVEKEVVVESEKAKLQRLHKELTELGVNRIGQLEVLIANCK